MSNDDFVDFDPPSASGEEQSDFQAATSRIASVNARAVMPDGKLMDRSQILAALGLNPGTSPTAWLAIIGCGSNASAMRPGDLQRVGLNRIASVSNALKTVAGRAVVDGGVMRESEDD